MTEFRAGDFIKVNNKTLKANACLDIIKDEIGMVFEIKEETEEVNNIVIFYAAIPHRQNADKLWYFRVEHIVKV